MTKDRRGEARRFLGLGLFTAASIGGGLLSLQASEEPGKVPEVDALREPPPDAEDWPLVSIIVPARNEERNLPALLPTLLAQHYPHYELLVVDDQSEDATPLILAEWTKRDTRLRVVKGNELPREEGWLGKPHAMQQGAVAAKGAWLLFTDADTKHRPLALSSSMAYAMSHDIDLFTILPFPELVTPIERLVMPVAYQGIAALYPAPRVNDPNDKTAIANGQYILIRREAYEAVGGAARVKDKIAEDLEFAKAVKGDGFRLRIMDGRDLMTVRMYTNVRELWEGWSKNVVLSFQGNPSAALVSVFGLFALTVAPFLLPYLAVRSLRNAARTKRRRDRLAAVWLAAVAGWDVLMPLLYRRRVDKALGLPLGWTFTQPLGGAIFALIILYSVIRLVTGKGVVWKGRTYAER